MQMYRTVKTTDKSGTGNYIFIIFYINYYDFLIQKA